MPIVMDDSIIRYGPPLNNQFKMASMKQRVSTSPFALTAHCLGSLTWIKKSSLSRDHNCDQNYAKPD